MKRQSAVALDATMQATYEFGQFAVCGGARCWLSRPSHAAKLIRRPLQVLESA